MTESRSSHVYQREIREDVRTSLSVLAGFVRAGSTVLDLGTGSGSLGTLLTRSKGCQVDGVTLNEEEAALARPGYRRVEVADLEDGAWARHFAGQRYDYIVCADVLEHLRRPEDTLRLCEGLLAPDGELLVSIPNAGYAGLVAELMHGEFRYRDEGLLDRTHLRFFTRRSLHQFLRDNGWGVAALETVERPLNESEFQQPFDAMPPAVARYLLALPDAGAYQFVLRARPHAGATAEAAATEGALAPLFSAQLYWSAGDGFAEDRKLLAQGRIGQLRQTLRFALPAGVDRLRLDPADRPGFLHLHALRLRAGEQALWTWGPDEAGVAALASAPQREMLLQPAWSGTSALLLLHGDDPWIELPIPAGALAATGAGGAVLEVDIGWPMSADYLALSQRVQPLQERIEELQPVAERAWEDQARLQETQAAWRSTEQQRQAIEAQLQRTAAEAAQLAGERERLAAQLQADRAELARASEAERSLRSLSAAQEDRLREIAEREAQLARETAALRHRNSELAQETRRLTHEKHVAQAGLRSVEGQFQQLATHLRWIENSTVFRMTRPVVHAKMAVDRLLGRGAAPAAATATALPAPGPQAQPLADTVDVIVPVYRGLEDTRRCIESVLASACQTGWRLLVLNDASPEPEVTQWLRAAAARDSRITLLENEVNLGFVGTVNRGMAVSDQHDVVLLNSDAEVANDWLDRLRRAAYADARVASVTPFSNNATICSYPRFCEANELPPGWDTAALDRVFAQANPGEVVDVPTGVGFCMYIRRDCLREVGLFDVEEFGKGYGEENDFCRRAADAGWRNLHALDTFVRHAGGVSFGESKSQREIDAVAKLRRLHPTYDRIVHEYVQADPPRRARMRADLLRARTSARPVILAVVHDRGGGTIRHAQELAQHLQQQAVFFLLTPAPGGAVRLELLEAGTSFRLQFAVPDQWGELLDTLRTLGVAHVHYHHLAGHQLPMFRLAPQLGVTWDFTAHDYHALCPHISLTDSADRFCGEDGAGDCRRCEPAAGERGLDAWRAGYGELLDEARNVLVPSLDVARRFRRMWPHAPVRVVPHADMPANAAPPVLPVAARGPRKALRIVVLGALSRIKGADVLEDAAVLAARQDLPLEFHLLGFAYRDLKSKPKADLIVHGAYEEKDLPRLLEKLQPDLVWFPAVWPETYSYTLSAALLAGLPIVAPNLGAFPERLSGRAWSWVAPWNQDARGWVAFFEQVRIAHFVPAVPPRVQWWAAEPAQARTWQYETDYVAGLAAPAGPVDIDAVVDAAMASSQAAASEAARERTVKMRTLGALRQLRGAPLLRPIARAVPQSLQTRVKAWLRA